MAWRCLDLLARHERCRSPRPALPEAGEQTLRERVVLVLDRHAGEQPRRWRRGDDEGVHACSRAAARRSSSATKPSAGARAPSTRPRGRRGCGSRRHRSCARGWRRFPSTAAPRPITGRPLESRTMPMNGSSTRRCAPSAAGTSAPARAAATGGACQHRATRPHRRAVIVPPCSAPVPCRAPAVGVIGPIAARAAPRGRGAPRAALHIGQCDSRLLVAIAPKPSQVEASSQPRAAIRPATPP